MSPDAAKLLEACRTVVLDPRFKSIYVEGQGWTTFCNFGVYEIFNMRGWGAILPRDAKNEPVLADALHAVLLRSPYWEQGTFKQAQDKANNGRPVILSRPQPAPHHGHVVVACPSDEPWTQSPSDAEWSSSWGQDVPMVANIGAAPKDPTDTTDHNSICRASLAFLEEPTCFIYCGNAV